jgi:hypothetical protein
MLLKAHHTIYLCGKDGPEYEPSAEINPLTGERKLVVKTIVVNGGDIFECYDPVASELLETSKRNPENPTVSVLDERDLLLWRMARGEIVEKREG